MDSEYNGFKNWPILVLIETTLKDYASQPER